MIEEAVEYTNGNQLAQEIYESLEAAAISTKKQNDFAFYLYVPSEIEAKKCSASIEENGYSCRIEEPFTPDEDWLCYISTTFIPSEDNLNKIGNLLIGLANNSSGEFDGWEIEQEVSPDVDYSAIAQNILESIKANFQPNHQFSEVIETAFPELDISFYKKVQSEVRNLGFQTLSDIEDKTITSQGIKTLIRTMRHPETNTISAFYYVPPLNMGVYEFETLLSNDVVVVSTIIPSSSQISENPMIVENHYPADTSVEELFKKHQIVINKLIESPSKIASKKVSDYKNLIIMQNMMNSHKYEHLEKIGWVTKEYLLAQTNGDENLANIIFKEIQKLT